MTHRQLPADRLARQVSWHANEDAEPLGDICIDGATVDGEAIRSGGSDRNALPKHLIFTIKPKKEHGSVMELRAESMSEARRWITLLKDAATAIPEAEGRIGIGSLGKELAAQQAAAPASAPEDAAPKRGVRRASTWRQAQAPEGNVYYYEEESGKTQWNRPTEAEDVKIIDDEPVAEAEGARPDGWQNFTDERGEVFWYHAASDASQWHEPAQVPSLSGLHPPSPPPGCFTATIPGSVCLVAVSYISCFRLLVTRHC